VNPDFLVLYGVPQTYNLASAIVGVFLAGAALAAVIGVPLAWFIFRMSDRRLSKKIASNSTFKNNNG